MAKANQKRLPGVEGSIPELDELAIEYAQFRDERMRLGTKEVDLKDRLLAEMKSRGKKTYKCGDVYIERVPGEETVKVKIDRPKAEKGRKADAEEEK